jgi:hypothetical protein
LLQAARASCWATAAWAAMASCAAAASEPRPAPLTAPAHLAPAPRACRAAAALRRSEPAPEVA